MKIFACIMMAFALLFMLPLQGYSIGSVTQAVANVVNDGGTPVFRTLTFAFTADSGDGSVPATAASAANILLTQGWFIHAVITNPGSPAPTDNYDITITEANGLDLLGATGVDRDTANTEICYPATNAPVLGVITLNVTGNSVNSAEGDVIVVLARIP